MSYLINDRDMYRGYELMPTSYRTGVKWSVLTSDGIRLESNLPDRNAAVTLIDNFVVGSVR